MKKTPATYTLTYDEIVAVFDKWSVAAAHVDPRTKTTAKDRADYFIATAQILNKETN